MCPVTRCEPRSDSRSGGGRPVLTEGNDQTPCEEARVSGHFKSHLKWPNTQQEWYFQGMSGNFRLDLKRPDRVWAAYVSPFHCTGCLPLWGSGWDGVDNCSCPCDMKHFHLAGEGRAGHLDSRFIVSDMFTSSKFNLYQ